MSGARYVPADSSIVVAASGDTTGVTDQAALAAALATGRKVELVPGQTYYHRQALILGATGQILDGNGATLKRVPQAVTTTATAITSGVTNQIAVAATSGGAGAAAWSLQVGDQIVVEQSGTFDAFARTISGIVGNVVTIAGTFGVTLSGTINVRHGYNQLVPNAADQRVTNVSFDGNLANWSWGRWQHTSAIQVFGAGARTRVDNCRVINQYGDGVTFAAAGCVLAFCDIENVRGRGFVFAGGGGNPTNLQNKVVFNRFVNTNGDTAVGGSDGTAAIDFSQGGPSSLIHGNAIDGGVDGIEIAAFNNSHCTVTANELFNLTGFGIGPGTFGAQGASEGVIVSQNRLYNCGIEIRSSAAKVRRWIIANNLIYRGGVTNGAIFASGADQIKIIGNLIYAGPIGAPKELIATAAAGSGSFAAGTYYYKITATNDAGESIPSSEVSAVVALNGRVILTWDFVPGASGYKVYRSTTPGGETSSPALVATITSSTTLTFTDGGAAASAGAAPATDTTRPTSGNLVTASTLTASSIENNTLIGGGNGIQGSGCTDLRVDGNTFLGNYLTGYTETDATQVTQIINNTFIADSNSGPAYVLLKLGGGPSRAQNNRFDCAGIATSVNAIVISQNGVVFENNTAIGGANGNLFSVGGSNCVIRHNNFDKLVGDSGSNNVKVGNRYNSSGILAGRATLVGGTVTVNVTEAKTADSILLTRVVASGTLGNLSVGPIVNGTSFVINSDNAADTSTVYWELRH